MLMYLCSKQWGIYCSGQVRFQNDCIYGGIAVKWRELDYREQPDKGNMIQAPLLWQAGAQQRSEPFIMPVRMRVNQYTVTCGKGCSLDTLMESFRCLVIISCITFHILINTACAINHSVPLWLSLGVKREADGDWGRGHHSERQRTESFGLRLEERGAQGPFSLHGSSPF